MNENEQDFSLEDIMKEFGAPAEPADAETPPETEPSPEAQENDRKWDLNALLKAFAPESESAPVEETATEEVDAPVDDAAAEEAPPPAEEAASPDLTATQAFSPVTDDAMNGDTIRLDPGKIAAQAAQSSAVSGETLRFTPVGQQEQSPAAPASEEAEPFSPDWEPQYEEPMGEYIPPEPIVFRPRSRLGELKRKLIEGPERRYYALVEQGFGKLQISIFLSLLVVILAVVSIVMNQMGMVQPDRMRLLVFGEIFAMLFSALLASNRLMEGISSLFHGKFTLDTLLTFTFLVCIADAVFCLREVRIPYCAAFCLSVTMSLWADYQRRNTELAQMDTLRKATRLHRVAKAPNCYDGRPGFTVTQGEVEDFMDNYRQTSTPEKVLSRYGIAAFVLSGLIGGLAGLQGSVSDGLRTWSAALLAATPVTLYICQTRPGAILERRLHRLGSVVCGWQGVKAMSGNAVVPLSDTALFPAGSVKVNGVKFYSQRDPDQIIAYATAVISAGDTCLTPLFTQLLESRNGHHFDAASFRVYDNGGIGGEVCGEPVLVGTLTFMQEMGVDLPEGARVNQAVYVAVDGELCGVFAMAFGKLKGVSAGLGTLCGYRGLTPVLSTDNFLLSEGFIRSKFGVNTRRIAFPSLAERQSVAAWTPSEEESIPCALTTQEGLAASAFAITGARALHTASKLGTALHMFGGIVGLLIVLVLTILGETALLTPANLLVFELIWAVPGLLITEWTRSL